MLWFLRIMEYVVKLIMYNGKCRNKLYDGWGNIKKIYSFQFILRLLIVLNIHSLFESTLKINLYLEF